MAKTELTDHEWPTEPGEHVWSEWAPKKGIPNPTQWRACVHPQCKAVEERPWPQ